MDSPDQSSLLHLNGQPFPTELGGVAPSDQALSRLDCRSARQVVWLLALEGIVPGEHYTETFDLKNLLSSVGMARATLPPSINLSGIMLPSSVSSAGANDPCHTWVIGSVPINFLLVGRRGLEAVANSAHASYGIAETAHTAAMRGSTSEAKQFLVEVDALREQVAEMRTVQAGCEKLFAATETEHGVGLATPSELEEASRQHLDAHTNAFVLQQRRVQARIDLCVALGGGVGSGPSIPDLNAPS